eukprot:jgi/Mesen1/9315/ME000060S08749
MPCPDCSRPRVELVHCQVLTCTPLLLTWTGWACQVSLPSFSMGLPAYHILAPSETSSNLARYDGVRYRKRVEGAAELVGMCKGARMAGFGPEVRCAPPACPSPPPPSLSLSYSHTHTRTLTHTRNLPFLALHPKALYADPYSRLIHRERGLALGTPSPAPESSPANF